MNPIIPESFFGFFRELAANNHKDWFDSQKSRYHESVKKPFEALVSSLLNSLVKEDPAYGSVRPADCIFRINRDVRFSNDKTPYKLNRSAIIATDGKKERGPSGFYFEIGPGECAFYAGAYMPEKPELLAIRRGIAFDIKGFRKVIGTTDFKKYFGEVLGDKNKRLDSEFSEAAALEPLIFNTQFYIRHDFLPEQATQKDFPEYLLNLHRRSVPFTAFLEEAVSKTRGKD